MLREGTPPAIEDVVPRPEESAKDAGLHYVTDAKPGIRRVGAGKGFRYIRPDGNEIEDPDDRLRIKALAIPPAWTDIWISPDGRGHLQATGRDARGRKQYRYHSRWRQVRDEAKFDSLIAFGDALPGLRRRLNQDLRREGLPREKVLAAIVQLLEDAQIRIGNEEYARENDSYGLTTLRDDQVRIQGDDIRFHFRGKSGKEHRLTLRDRRLAKLVRRCRDIPGQHLFQYRDGGDEFEAIHSEDVNAYLRGITGLDFTAKHFRTWAATVLAAAALSAAGPFESKAEAKRKVTEAIQATADHLGNTVTICRKCYVHPSVIESYMEGSLEKYFERPDQQAGLSPDEAAVLTLLRSRARIS